MTKLFIDFETRSTIDIKRAGAWKYAMHPSTEVLCMAFCYFPHKKPLLFTGEEMKTGGFPITSDTIVVAHNAHFEYAIWNYILHKRYGWPALWSPSRWSCTLSRAAAANLPLSLEHCGNALNIAKPKDTIKGRQAMHKLCKPTGVSIFGEPEWCEDADVKETLYEYCKRDVEAEMELDRLLPPLSKEERRVWELDLRINHRGILADVPTAHKAIGLAEVFTTALNKKLYTLTGGAVEKATRIAGIKSWLKGQGVEVESLDKNSVLAMLKDTKIPQAVKDVITIRQAVGKSSTAKYQAIVEAAGADNRIRGTLQYHAAGTGRWGGRMVQPQNLPKGTEKKGMTEVALAHLQTMTAAEFAAAHPRPMDTLASCIRGTMLVAPKGKDLIAADYAAIEARVLLWLADDVLALDKYRRGVNLYVDMARFVYNTAAIVKPDEKQSTYAKEYALGKAIILGCGYGMGKDKFHATCAAQGQDVSVELAEKAVKAYRNKYETVVAMWHEVEAAARQAVRTPGSTFACCGGKAWWTVQGRFLTCALPSGRRLRYYRPSLKTIDTPYGEKEEIHYWAAGLNGAIEEYKTYGGSLVENITQAVARDLMANGMLQCEGGGYKVILTVHDELVAEVDEGFGSVDEFIKLMCLLPAWADGCPVAAEGWRGKRYKK